MADTAGTITGLAGVVIWTESYGPMRRFYTETLGLTPRSDRENFINFEWGDVRVTLTVHPDVHGLASDPLRIMVNFIVDDIQATYARLNGAGVAFSRVPEQEEWGGWIATFSDPDGNILQLFQLPPE